MLPSCTRMFSSSQNEVLHLSDISPAPGPTVHVHRLHPLSLCPRLWVCKYLLGQTTFPQLWSLCAEVGLQDPVDNSIFQSLRNLQAAFYIASFYMLRLKFLWTPISCFFYSNCQSNGCLTVVFIYISLMVSDVNHLFLILGFIGHLLSFIFLLRHLC